MNPIPKPVRRGPKPPRRIGRRKRLNPFATYQSLAGLCNDTFTLWVRVRDKNRCRLCGDSHLTQGAHLISRRYKQCSLLGENCWCLCQRCHARWTHDPLGWDDLMERTFGVVEWGRRKLLARIPTKPDYHTLRPLLLRLLMEEVRDKGTSGLDAQIDKMVLRHEAHERKA